MGIGPAELIVILSIAAIPGLLALIDILRSEFPGNGKLLWLLAVAFFPLVGSIAYLAIGRRQRLP